ncbi:RES domain-containing protein [Candidatus Poriferisodalis sp.]|uniref:RES domain-containing protein n=1 Tax=Candidatus Poriferisodalis sp. TaxID=3101277 RepID=UPI003B5AB966
MSFTTTRIGGRYLRIVDWHWRDPLDATFAARPPGQRWNPPGLRCLYLNADIATARANVMSRFADRPLSIDEVDPASAPHLVEIEVPNGTAADAFTQSGLTLLGLPASYPHEADGTIVPHSKCQPIGQAAFDAGHNGVDCRSAATHGGRELAWFPDTGTARLVSRKPQPQWW